MNQLAAEERADCSVTGSVIQHGILSTKIIYKAVQMDGEDEEKRRRD